MKKKSVKSSNPLKSPEYLGTGVIQMIIVKAHGGKLIVESVEGEGTMFSFILLSQTT